MAAQFRCLNLVLSGLLMGCSTEKVPATSPETGAIIQVFKSNDKNNDGCLSSSEWKIMADTATDAVKNQSSNSDQFRSWILEIFSEIDSDRNGCVSVSEYSQFSKKSRLVGTQTGH